MFGHIIGACRNDEPDKGNEEIRLTCGRAIQQFLQDTYDALRLMI